MNVRAAVMLLISMLLVGNVCSPALALEDLSTYDDLSASSRYLDSSLRGYRFTTVVTPAMASLGHTMQGFNSFAGAGSLESWEQPQLQQNLHLPSWSQPAIMPIPPISLPSLPSSAIFQSTLSGSAWQTYDMSAFGQDMMSRMITRATVLQTPNASDYWIQQKMASDIARFGGWYISTVSSLGGEFGLREIADLSMGTAGELFKPTPDIIDNISTGLGMTSTVHDIIHGGLTDLTIGSGANALSTHGNELLDRLREPIVIQRFIPINQQMMDPFSGGLTSMVGEVAVTKTYSFDPFSLSNCPKFGMPEIFEGSETTTTREQLSMTTRIGGSLQNLGNDSWNTMPAWSNISSVNPISLSSFSANNLSMSSFDSLSSANWLSNLQAMADLQRISIQNLYASPSMPYLSLQSNYSATLSMQNYQMHYSYTAPSFQMRSFNTMPSMPLSYGGH